MEKPSKILDIACGTGAVVNEISQKTNHTHHHDIIGVDLSYNALKIAKKWAANRPNINFIVADVENFHINEKFDVVTCQFALFFFPDAYLVLQNVKNLLKKNGKLCIAVHGKIVPYFNCILDVVPKFIPDYIPKGSPNLDRFGSKLALRRIAKKSGFTETRIYQQEFTYSPGNFSNYWSNYLRYISTPLQEKLNKLPKSQKSLMITQIKEKTLPYTKKNKIVFPWQVFILTAKKP